MLKSKVAASQEFSFWNFEVEVIGWLIFSSQKSPLIPLFQRGKGTKMGTREKKSLVRNSKKSAFSVPLFEKKGLGEIWYKDTNVSSSV
jgi:hypothetical protein